MSATDHTDGRSAKLFTIEANGNMQHLPRRDLAALFSPGDVVVANDAATLPASLHGTHMASGEPVEVRLAGWMSVGDPTRFVAIVFGAGDHRIATEDRPPPPLLFPGDRLSLGPLVAVIERLIDHPRLVELRFTGDRAAVLTGLAHHGRAIQYAYIPEPLALWDIWTRIAAEPLAFEAPSAGFALDWRTLATWRRRGIGFATLTHAAGISSILRSTSGSLSMNHTVSPSGPWRRSNGRDQQAGTSLPSEPAWCAHSNPPRLSPAEFAQEMVLPMGASRREPHSVSSMRSSPAFTSPVIAILSSFAPSSIIGC
jgi:hypothetical protein